MSSQSSRHTQINTYTKHVRYHFILKNDFLEVLLVYEARQDLKAIIYIHGFECTWHEYSFDTKITSTAS